MKMHNMRSLIVHIQAFHLMDLKQLSVFQQI